MLVEETRLVATLPFICWGIKREKRKRRGEAVCLFCFPLVGSFVLVCGWFFCLFLGWLVRLSLAFLPCYVVLWVCWFVVVALVSSLSVLVSGFSVFGFSGSRSLLPCSVAALRFLAGLVPSGSAVSVGCARGADCVARGLFPAARVFSVSSGLFGSGRSAFARRSVACVGSVAPAGLWCFFPSSACPAGLLPSSSSSRCFCGLGSGSWASAAFALGSGCSVLCFLPPAVSAPAGWGLVSVGGGWWVARPAVAQLSLFA